MSSPVRRVILPAVALALAAAFLAGRWSSPGDAPRSSLVAPSQAEAVREPDRRSPAPALATSSLAHDDELRRLVREEVAQVVHEELARFRPPALPSGAPADAPAAAVLARTPEALAAADAARSLLEAASTRRRFTGADRTRWLELLARLPGEERFELERQLIVAVNRDLVVPEPGAFPPVSTPRTP